MGSRSVVCNILFVTLCLLQFFPPDGSDFGGVLAGAFLCPFLLPPVSMEPFCREISPIHFPSPNASYEAFDAKKPKQKRGACCTGTPPRVLDRNKVGRNVLFMHKEKQMDRLGWTKGSKGMWCGVGVGTPTMLRLSLSRDSEKKGD